MGCSDDKFTEDDAASWPKARGEVDRLGLLVPWSSEADSSGLMRVDARSASKRSAGKVPASSTYSERDWSGGEMADPAKSRSAGETWAWSRS